MYLLQIDIQKIKDSITSEIKAYYDDEKLTKNDIFDIAINTEKEEELFDYANIDIVFRKMIYDYFKFNLESCKRRPFLNPIKNIIKHGSCQAKLYFYYFIASFGYLNNPVFWFEK